LDPRATAWVPRLGTRDAQRASPRAAAGSNDQVLAAHNERRRGHQPGNHERGAAGIGLGTTIKYLRGAASIGLGTTIK
jgi:hypothetical protein